MTGGAAIEAAWIGRAGGAAQRVRHGFSRPDVAAAFPAFAQATHSGWHASVAAAESGDDALVLTIRWAGGALAAGPLRIVKGEVQHIALAAVATPVEAVTEEELEASTLDQRLQALLAARPGLTVRLDIVNKCNLRCVMCHYADERVFKRPAQHITPEQFAAFFAPLAPAVREVVLSCGDEPLVSPHFEAIVRYLADQHPHVEVLFSTNGMLFSERHARTVIASGAALVMFSIDGVTAATFEAVRCGARFGQVVGNFVRLRRLREAAGSARPLLVVNYVLMRRNIHEAPLFVAAARELGVHYIDFRHVVPGERYDAADDTLETQPSQFNHYRGRILAAAQVHGVTVYLPPPLPGGGAYDARADPVATLDDFKAAVAAAPTVTGTVAAAPFTKPLRDTRGTPTEEFSGLFCERPFSEVMIRNQDEVLPCPYHGKVLDRLSSGRGLAAIFAGEAFQKLRRNMLRLEGDPDCAACPIKHQQLPQVCHPPT